ncbi:hypothetical protein PIB30_091369 [Stylosanthes scabra]|uniref:PGG domain-containing protein n=1 Tax=Stylosanthes scabra TaxID=79078 RepID=A0ABU6RV84_9FABA|nr:hypothetical protein [Stylosanthes scabra]
MANISEELHAAASLGQIDTIYVAIEQNPYILEEIDAEPFANTPLHTAAFAGRLEFCIEIMRLKPSFGRKLNRQGFSPIHIALLNNQHNLVRRLVEINKDLVRIKGREGVTPLHFVCQSGDDEDNIRLLTDLLEACPDCIEDVNMRNESALHVALLNENLRAFQVLYGRVTNNTRKNALLQETSILNWRDSDGNTILHIATLHDNKEINEKNLEKQTALDIAEAHDSRMIKTTLLEVGAKRGTSIVDDSKPENKIKSKLSISYFRILFRRIQAEASEERRNTILVIGTLFVTAIYQTVLSPPGGLTQGGSDNTSTAIAAGKSFLSGAAFGASTHFRFLQWIEIRY